MVRICVNCQQPADTIQHLLPKSSTQPEDYIRIPMCSKCHNYGPFSANAIGDGILANLDNEPSCQEVEVNGINIIAQAGSRISGDFETIPEECMWLRIKNLKTGLSRDIDLIKSGSQFTASGTAIVDDWYGYVLLSKE